MNFGESWADNEDEALRLRFRRGETDAEIAVALIRRTESAVRMRRIGMKLSRSQEWNDADTRRLRELFADGYQDTEIAIEIGKSERSVCNRRYRLQLRRYKRDTRPPRADSRTVIESCRTSLECIEAMCRSPGYSKRDIQDEVRAALASISTPRASVA